MIIYTIVRRIVGLIICSLLLCLFTSQQVKNYNAQNIQNKDVVEYLGRLEDGFIPDTDSLFALGAEALVFAEEYKNDYHKALIFQYYGNHFLYLNNFERATLYYDSSNYYAREVKDSMIIVSNEVRKNISREYRNTIESEASLKKWLVVSERNNYDETSMLIYNGLGVLYENRRDLSKALESYLNALKIAERSNNIKYQAVVSNNLGLLWYGKKDLNTARTYFFKGLEFAEALGDNRLIFNLKNNIGLIFIEQKQYHEALLHFEELLDFLHKYPSFSVNKAMVYINMASIYLSLDDFESVKKYTDLALNIIQENNITLFKSKPIFLLAKSYYKQSKSKQAVKYYEKALLEAKRNNIFDGNLYEDVLEGLLTLSEIHEVNKNYEKAHYLYKEYTVFKDSIKSLVNEKKIQELELKYKEGKKEAERINELNQQKLSNKETELKKSRYIIIFSFVIFILLVIMIVIHERHQKIRRKEQQYFSQKILNRIEVERQRIASDLHDNIGQCLSLIKSKINLYQKGELDDLNGLSNDVGDVVNQTRSISHDIYPFELRKIGLKKSIQSLLSKVYLNTGVITNFDISEEVDSFSEDLQVQLYRISQEAVTNTIKHANANSILIKIEKRGNTVWRYSYKDNGKGIERVKFENKKGLGLQTISERVKSINGKMKISNFSGKGFGLEIKF